MRRGRRDESRGGHRRLRPPTVQSPLWTRFRVQLAPFDDFSPGVNQAGPNMPIPMPLGMEYERTVTSFEEHPPAARRSRTDRIAKYNQLLRIEEQLGSAAVYGAELRK